MSFLTDFYNYSFGSGTECHPNYIRWSAFLPLAIAAGRRYFFMQGRLYRTPELCLVFIGESGSKKSYAKDCAKLLVERALPEIPIAVDVTSRDDLMRWMSSKDTCRYYINHEGAECPWHPIALFIDELRHFMSYYPSAMIAFLVAIHGQKRFKGSTIKRGLEDIVEPCVNLLACTTQDWFSENTRVILAGGWTRRFLVLYEPELTDTCISVPYPHPEENALITRMSTHLQKLTQHTGVYQWGPGAEAFYNDWYVENRKHLPTDPHLRAYFLTKDLQLFKIVIMLDLAEDEPSLLITKQNIGKALLMFETLEMNLSRLYLGAGRNEFVLPQQRLLEFIRHSGGAISRVQAMRFLEKDLRPVEQLQLFRHIQDSKHVILMPAKTGSNGNVPTEAWVLPSKTKEFAEGGNVLPMKPTDKKSGPEPAV